MLLVKSRGDGSFWHKFMAIYFPTARPACVAGGLVSQRNLEAKRHFFLAAHKERKGAGGFFPFFPRLLANPLAGWPVAFTASSSPPKQKHSRGKSLCYPGYFPTWFELRILPREPSTVSTRLSRGIQDNLPMWLWRKKERNSTRSATAATGISRKYSLCFHVLSYFLKI